MRNAIFAYLVRDPRDIRLLTLQFTASRTTQTVLGYPWELDAQRNKTVVRRTILVGR